MHSVYGPWSSHTGQAFSSCTTVCTISGTLLLSLLGPYPEPQASGPTETCCGMDLVGSWCTGPSGSLRARACVSRSLRSI